MLAAKGVKNFRGNKITEKAVNLHGHSRAFKLNQANLFDLLGWVWEL